MMDFFGLKAKVELAGVRAALAAKEARIADLEANYQALDRHREAEINRLGDLLRSTTMKVIAMANPNIARVAQTLEFPPAPKEPKPETPPPFIRGKKMQAALGKVNNGAQVSE